MLCYVNLIQLDGKLDDLTDWNIDNMKHDKIIGRNDKIYEINQFLKVFNIII